MAYRSIQQARRELFDVAATQGGYFTAKQAAAAGYGKRHLDYHVKAGNFERVERGLFRLPIVGPVEHEDLIRLSLWSRGRDDQPQAVASHQTALSVHGLGDYLSFRIADASTQHQGAPQGGARFPVEARMAGRVFGSFHVDVGIGDAVYGVPDRLQGEDLLAFAGLAPAEALAIPNAQQFAEKIHAYTYPWSDRMNTRSRDLVDALLLLQRSPPDAEDTKAAVQATFSTRGTHPIPDELPAPPDAWTDEFASMATEVELATTTLAAGFTMLSEYWRSQGFADIQR